MIFKNIHISGFGKYTHEDISFSEGINVIYGDNGSGKTTLHAFLKSVLFGMERGRGKAAKGDAYSHYLPWDGQSVYGGSLTLETEEGEFLVERCLDSRKRSVTVRRAASGQVVGSSQEDVDKLLHRLTEEAYRNTISIEQLKAATDSSLSAGLKNHLSSLSLSGTSTLDVSSTMASLKEKKKELRASLDKEASARYQAVFQEICEMEDRLKDLGSKPEQLEQKISGLKEKLEAEAARQETLEALNKEKESALASHSMSRIRDTDIYQERLRDAFDAHRLASKETQLHEKRALRIRDLVSGTLAFLIFLLLGLGTLFYEQLPFSSTPFPLPQIPFVIFFFAAAALSFLVTVILFVRSRKDDSDSEAMALETEQFLKTEFQTHLGSQEVSEENQKALLEKLSGYLSLRKEAEKAKNDLAISLKTTVSLQKELQAAQEEMSVCQKEAWEFEQAVSRLSDLEDQKTQLGQAVKQNQQIEEKLKALTLAEETISRLSAQIHEAYSPILGKRVSQILCSITDGVYDRLYIDEDLSITLRRDGRSIPLESLSRGTIEQVYLALRLSAVEILYPDASFPILLDDTFAYYDDTRLHNTLKWLAENYPGQVLLFTCHKREAAFLSRLGVQYHLVALS